MRQKNEAVRQLELAYHDSRRRAFAASRGHWASQTAFSHEGDAVRVWLQPPCWFISRLGSHARADKAR